MACRSSTRRNVNRNRWVRVPPEEDHGRFAAMCAAFEMAAWMCALVAMFALGVQFLAMGQLASKTSSRAVAHLVPGVPAPQVQGGACDAAVDYQASSGRVRSVVRLPPAACAEAFGPASNGTVAVSFSALSPHYVRFGPPEVSLAVQHRLVAQMAGVFFLAVFVGAWCAFMSWMVRSLDAVGH
jgi:hypothetical protein